MRNQFFSALAFIGFSSVSGVMLASGAITIPTTSALTQNGFYLAADIGAADFMTKESHSVNPESHQLGSMGIIGGGYVGYDFDVSNRFRLAMEGFGDATGLNTNLKHSANIYQMSQNYNLGIRLLPEYVFTPNIVGHIILGYANGNFSIKDNGVYGYINTSYNLSGFQTGIGFTTTLKNNLFVRLDALYDIYSSSTSRGLGLEGSGEPFQYYTNTFSQLAGELSLIYKFC